jgi:DNA-directed RNA polymerase subunit RPC12/RpoP
MEKVTVKCSKCGKPAKGEKFMADLGVPFSCEECNEKMNKKMLARIRANNQGDKE